MIRDGFRDALQLLLQLDTSVIDAAICSLWVSILAVTAASVVGVGIGLLLARKHFIGQPLLVAIFRVGMSVPTVLIGLLCFGMLSRRGALSEFDLLYTTWAIVIGEFFLALPIVTTWTHGAIVKLDPRVAETAITLGAGRLQRTLSYLNEARLAIMLAVLTAFSRCFTELGIAMMVGGNIRGRTRTLTTETALLTAKGEFSHAMAMGLILLLIAMLVTFAISLISQADEGSES